MLKTKITFLLKTIISLFILTKIAYADLQNDIERIIKNIAPNLNIGIDVFDLTTKRSLYSRNATKLYTPASNMKLFSNAAALMILGPDYRFVNFLSTNASSLEKGILNGSLGLSLSGDPTFTYKRLAGLIKSLKSWKINNIAGNIYIDSSHAKIDPYPPGWDKKDLIYSYAAPIAPLMIDANRLTIIINPANQINNKSIIETNNPGLKLSLNNQIYTKIKKTHCSINIMMNKYNAITTSGCVNIGQMAVKQQIAIQNPFLYIKSLINKLLKENNITFKGKILLGKISKNSILIKSEKSKSIAQILADTLKQSDNLYADSLFLHAAGTLNGSPINWKYAQILIKKFLKQTTGNSLDNATIVDGSGLSRLNFVTPQQTVKLLHFLYQRFPLSYEYIAALPVSGRDGTLQNRLTKPTEQGLIRAKTGTMKGILSLSGFLYTANAHTLAFAIYINSYKFTALHRYLIDSLCDYLLQQRPTNIVKANNIAPPKLQRRPTEAKLQRQKNAKWRQLEIAVKRSLYNQEVTILYYDHKLIIKDDQNDNLKVLNVLSALRKKFSFATILTSDNLPTSRKFLLWVKLDNSSNRARRIWTIREVIS